MGGSEIRGKATGGRELRGVTAALACSFAWCCPPPGAVAAETSPAAAAVLRPLPEACRSTSPRSVFVETVLASNEVLLSDGRRVRLSGVAPARAPLGETTSETARRATHLERMGRRLLDRTTEAEELELHDFGEDRHGRRVGHLVATSSGQDVASVLVAAGLLRVAFHAETPACTRTRLGFEAEARATGSGMWGIARLGLWRADDPALAGMVGAEVVVEGRPVSVRRSGTRTYLNFGRDFRRDFAVVLDDKSAETSAARGTVADGLRGRSLRIRGILLQREGLRIEPATADQLEWVNR